MRTKSFSAKRLLSLLLTVAMFATMILPASVFAADITVDYAYVCMTEIENGAQMPQLRLVFSGDVALDDNWADMMTVTGKDDWMGSGAIRVVESNKIYVYLGTGYTLASGDIVDFGGAITPSYSLDTLVDASATLTGGFDLTTVKVGTITPSDATVTLSKNGYVYTLPAEVGLGNYSVKIEKDGYITKTYPLTIASSFIGGVHELNDELVKLADFTALNVALTDAATANTDNCTVDSISAFNTALAAANAINQNTTTEADQAVVNAAATALSDAISGLTQLANFAAYDNAIAAVNALVRTNYTTGSLNALDAVVTANAIDKTNEADQTKVDNAANAITTAIANLVETRVVEFTAVAVASNVTANYAKADEIYLVFSEAIQGSPNLISDLKVDGESASGYLADAGWVDNTIYRIDIIGDIDNDATIEFVGNDNILAVAGHALKGFTTTIVGNLDEAYEEVTATSMTATIVNVDDMPYMVDGDEIVLVFNAPVYGNPNTIIAEGMTFAVVANTSNTVYKKVLDADADTVTVGMPLTFDDGTGRTAITTTLKGTFGGTVVPEVVRALVEDVDGTAKTAGDKINVFFNAPTNKTAGTVENTFTGVLAGATGEWLDNQTLVITLGNTAITVNDKIDLTNLGIKDFYGTKDADADEIELEGSFGTAIQPALLTLTAISKQGKGAPSAGDEIYLAFNVKMREDALNLQSDFDFNYGDYGTGASVAWATGDEYAEYSTIIITLGEGANVVPGTTKITIEKELFEESGIKSCEVSNLENRIVTGTFGTSIAPSLISASIVKRSTVVGSQAGDQIVLLFNVPTNAADIINLISVANGDLGNNVEEGVWTNNNTIYTITLGDGTSIANDTTITFTNTNGVLKDINNQKVAATKTLALNGSFGVEADEVGISPSSVTATIVKTTADAGAQAGDKIVFAFNVATNGVDLVNYFVSKGIYGTGLTGGWSNGNTVYTLVLGTGATVTDTNVVEFTVEAGIKDKNEINGAVTLTAGAFIGSFGATITPSSVAPTLLSATIVKGDGNTSGAAQAGDKVVFAFNMATNKADLFATLGGATLFGSNAPVQPAWNEDGNIYTVTLGENASITDDSVLSISADAGLKDKQAYSASAAINGIELIGSFGVEVIPVAPQPELLRVDIVKASADMGAQPGDKLRFIFNINTNEVDDLISKIQQTLNGSSIVAFGNGAEGDWVEKNIYEITLGTNPNMQTGVKLVIPASAGIKDESGTSVAKEYTVNGFNGTFGESIAPEALSAVAFSDDGVDYIEVVFNVAVKRLADGIMIFENNSNFLGTEPYGEWMSDNIYRITLDDDFTITNTSLLHFNDTYKIYSKDGNAEMVAGSTIAVTGELRKPMVTEVYAGTKIVNGDDVTYEAAETITIVFSSKTNGDDAIDLSAQSSLLGIGATATWNDAKTELTIALGTDRKISAGSGYILLNGLGITNGFDNNEVVGQYSISAGILPEDELETDLIRVNTREDNNNYMTVIFNAPTNMYGKTLATEFNMSDIEANIEATHTFGTGATAEWESASKLVIKLAAGSTFKNEKAVAENATVTFKNLKFANGLGSIKVEAEKVTGSFDGRETKLEGLTAKVEGDYTVAKVTLNKQDLDFGKNNDNDVDNFDAIVTFVIWDKQGKLVTDMNSMNIDVNAVDEIELQSKFATKEAGKVDVYVTDTYIDAITEGTPTFDLLADTVTSAVAAQ